MNKAFRWLALAVMAAGAGPLLRAYDLLTDGSGQYTIK